MTMTEPAEEEATVHFDDDKIKFKGKLAFVEASQGYDTFVANLCPAKYHDAEWVEIEDGRMDIDLTVPKDIRDALEGRRVKVTIKVLPQLDEWVGNKWHTKKRGYVWVCHYNDSVSNGWRWEHHHPRGSVISQRFYEDEDECKANALEHLNTFTW